MDFGNFTYIKSHELKNDAVKSIISFDGVKNSNNDILVLFKTYYQYPKENAKSYFHYTTNDINESEERLIESLIKKSTNNENIFHFEIIEEFNSNNCRVLESNILLPNNRFFDIIFSIALETKDEFLENVKKLNINSKVMKSNVFYIATATRRDGLEYRYTESNIINSFKNNFLSKGKYNNEENVIFGDTYYNASFGNAKECLVFKEFVEERIPYEVSKKRRRMLTGEDIDMFNERKLDSSSTQKETICDTHVDGA